MQFYRLYGKVTSLDRPAGTPKSLQFTVSVNVSQRRNSNKNLSQ
jgi:hypothetical protein